MYQINLFENVKSPQNPVIITDQDYINYVKNGINEKEVLKARVYGKGSKLYESIKLNRLCVTHNFIFKDHKRDTNIISSSGLLYFDIDTNFDFNLIDKSKVYIHHKSFGGNGSSIIVKVDGITVDNFESSYRHIANNLQIANLIDSNAIKKTQFTVLSFDPNIYHNPNSFVFTATEKVSFGSNMSSSSNLLRNDTFLINNNSTRFRITNASDYVEFDKEYQVFPDGISTAKIDIPRNIPVGNRTNVMMAIVTQMVSLNPNQTEEQTLNRALAINNIISKEPLSYGAVVGIVNSILRYSKENTLKPINNKIRKVIFNENSKLTKAEKIDIVNKEVGAIRTQATKQKIYDAIEQWDSIEKITAKKVAEKIGIGESTVKKYWSKFKTVISETNKRHKSKV